MKFSELNLHPKLQSNLDKIGFTECTKIQEQAIPLVRTGKDISGLAQTGTGKTGAFLIPLIDRLLKAVSPDASVQDSASVAFPEWKKKQYILCLVPTRELAEQVQENAIRFLEGTGLSSVSIYGGTTYDKQTAALKEGVEFVIATPGRFIDLYKEHHADLGLVRAVVFDEADRMFDMGFKEDMKFVLKRIPRDRQFLVFSATMNFDVLNTAYEYGADPVEINISRDQAKADNVKDYIVHIGQEDKPRYLLSILKKFNPRQTIIFSNFKHNVERVAKFLNSNGVPAVGISSLLTQAQRNRVMEQFKAENDRNILVATDLAARGLDILGVDLVINYDLPDDSENYVHRIGRTGRAGQTGQAFSMVSDRDVDALQRIEEYLKHKIENLWLEESEILVDVKPFPRDESRPRGRFEKRGDGRGPAVGSGGGHRDRNRDQGRGKDRDRGGGRGGGDRQARGGGPRPARQEGGHHRDRQSGRPGRPQGASGGGSRPTPNGQAPRPQHQQPRANEARRPRHHGGNTSAANAPGSRRPVGTRPQSRPTPVVAKQSLGQKVTGLFKRLLGK